MDDLRQKLRMRGLRCHPMYCRSSTRLQTVPLLASRAQALRYIRLGEQGHSINVDLCCWAEMSLHCLQHFGNHSFHLIKLLKLRAIRGPNRMRGVCCKQLLGEWLVMYPVMPDNQQRTRSDKKREERMGRRSGKGTRKIRRMEKTNWCSFFFFFLYK